MNKNLSATLITWETRNKKKIHEALVLCKNYGLKPLLKNICIGNLYPKEKNDLLKKMKSLFLKQTDKIYMVNLCKSCFDVSLIEEAVKNTMKNFKTFEIICLEKPAKRPKNQAPV